MDSARAADAGGTFAVNTRLLGLGGGVLVLHSLCTLLHEKVFLSGLKVGWFLTLLEFVSNLVLECAHRYWKRRGAAGRPGAARHLLSGFRPLHLASAVASCLGRGTSNLSFMHLNCTSNARVRSGGGMGARWTARRWGDRRRAPL